MGHKKKNLDEYNKIYNNQNSINDYDDDDKYEDDKYYESIPDYLGYLPDCPYCGSQLKYNYIQSKYKCPSCNKEIDEYDVKIDEDPNDIPYCCKSCGGPYPSCKTSCKIFDD